MFEPAIEAAAAAASDWSPEREDPSGGHGCCRLCLQRYRPLVLNGPLRDLPHVVAHAAVVVVDDIISDQVDASLDQLQWQTWISPAPDQDRDLALLQRLQAATGALTMAALEELSRAEWRLDDLRRRFTDPALAAYLGAHGTDEFPAQWEL